MCEANTALSKLQGISEENNNIIARGILIHTQTHSSLSSIVLYIIYVLTCIRMCLGRRDAHEAAGSPTADRGYLMSSR